MYAQESIDGVVRRERAGVECAGGLSQDDGRAWCRGRRCDAILGQTEHGGGGGARTRMSTAVSSGGSRGDSRTGRSGVGYGVGVRRGFEAHCASWRQQQQAERWARASATRRLAMQEALGPTGLSLLALGGALAARVEGEGSGVCGKKVWLRRAAARGVRDRNLLCRLARDHCFLSDG
jgi:hypothetical protein